MNERIAIDGQAFGLALDEQGDRLYMVDTRGAALSALDIESGEVAATLELAGDRAASNDARPPQPRLAVFDPESGRVYVSGVADEGVIWVVNGADMTLETTFENVGSRPAGLALDRERGRLYVTLLGSDQIAVIDTQGGEVVETFDLAVEGATNLALDSEGDRLYVTHQKTADVTVLDTANGEVVDTLESGEGALDLLLAGSNLWVTNRDAHTVLRFDRESHDLLDTIATDLMPNSLLAIPGEAGVYTSLKQALDDDLKAPGPDAVVHLIPEGLER